MDTELEDLQIRVTHQDLAIETLNETVARQDREIARLRQELQQLRELVRELRPSPVGGDAVDEPPPPHY